MDDKKSEKKDVHITIPKLEIKSDSQIEKRKAIQANLLKKIQKMFKIT
jgi:hypothetical protein